ncbi:uncharacterized protein LAJ45_00058 [Morchella importuna]|uniref:Uncharacterized protein n=1 Tax=Morchella conica CCBAS932 TaxID=1392247 RepID=A0A3N4KH08_9PEZI|nr:uncharacterized protein LAJ45_00058 [Morchella importuna]KAH8155049.1 hypothetical protein LAJ45_00058 [Morchella importuna]RPB09817.1 hypothetical protein P167DRAFT_287052 [Morchella conica CCBAS932]
MRNLLIGEGGGGDGRNDAAVDQLSAKETASGSEYSENESVNFDSDDDSDPEFDLSLFRSGAINTPNGMFVFPLLAQYRIGYLYTLLLLFTHPQCPTHPTTHRLLALLRDAILKAPLIPTITSEFYLLTTNYETLLLTGWAIMRTHRARGVSAAFKQRSPFYVVASRYRTTFIVTKASFESPIAVWAEGVKTPSWFYQLHHPRGEYYYYMPGFNLSFRRWLEIMVFRPARRHELLKVVRNAQMEVVGLEWDMGCVPGRWFVGRLGVANCRRVGGGGAQPGGR